jgi:hypothetical protein
MRYSLYVMTTSQSPPRFLILTTMAFFVFAVAAAVLFFRADRVHSKPSSLSNKEQVIGKP